MSELQKIALDLEAVGKLIGRSKVLAREYRELTGRPLGITGEVAEYEAARLLNLRLSPARQAGYDATSPDGTRFQIKGRVLRDNSKSGQRIGSLRLKHEWEAILLVLLDADFEPVAIYNAQRPDLEIILNTPSSRARNERGALGIRQFQSIARLVWSRDAQSSAA